MKNIKKKLHFGVDKIVEQIYFIKYCCKDSNEVNTDRSEI